MERRLVRLLYLELVVLKRLSLLLQLARFWLRREENTLSVSVARMHLDPMLQAVTEEGKSDTDVHAEVGMSDADKKGALQVTQPNETDRGEWKA